MKDREAIARAYCKWSNVDPDMVFAVNEDMTEAAIPAWQQRTALGMADAIINGLADAGLTIASVASLTRAEEEREEAVKAMDAIIRADIGAYTANHKPPEEWDTYDHSVLPLWQHMISVHARLSRDQVESGTDA